MLSSQSPLAARHYLHSIPPRRTRIVRWTLAAAAALIAPLFTLGAQQPTKRAFALIDWYKLATLSAPAMSPDGGRVAFTVQTINEKDNKYHHEVWVAPTSAGAATRFTSPSTESSNPR